MGAKKGMHQSPATEFKLGNRARAKYNTEICDDIIEFFETYEGYPTFEKFASERRLTTKTLLEWKKKYPRFTVAYEVCLEMQKAKTLEGGITGVYNPQIVKFIATNCHGMTEKTEQRVDADIGGKGVTVNITVEGE